MKNPDSVLNAVQEAVKEDVANNNWLSDEEAEDIVDWRIENQLELLKTWIRHNEYITVEFDTEAKTARVLAVKELQ